MLTWILVKLSQQGSEKLVLRGGGLMDPGKHIAHVAERIMRVELDRSQSAIWPTLSQRVYKQLNNGVTPRAAVFVQCVFEQYGSIG